MFDVDKFIECIHEKPALWDKRSKEYSDKNCRERSWIEIGEIMFENWLELELKERDNKVKEMKNRWRHIRDNFHKFVNQGKSGDAAPKKKEYVYADALTFLLQAMEKRKTSGNIAVEEEDEEEEIREYDEDEEGLAANVSSIEPGASSQPLKVSQTGNRQRSNLTSFQSELLKKLEDKQEEEDADKSFLVSLLPDYKKLNDDEKLDFRLTTLKFFRDIRRKKNFHSLPPSPSTQSSYSPTQLTHTNLSYYQFQGPPPMQTPSRSVTPFPLHQSTSGLYNNPPTSPQDSIQSIDSGHSQMTYYESI